VKSIRFWLIFPLAFGLMLAIAYLPLPIQPYLDFQALYHANLGVLRGIPLYDLTGQVNMIAELAGVTPDKVLLLPFVYPPWYSLLTLPLALLPIEVAARLWFEVNLFIVMTFVWLLTENWPARRRLLSFLFAILFLPVLGALFVGQFVFPVLLGGGILAHALRHERVWLTACALILLTFKPHIGGLAFLAGLIYLALRRDGFSRRALWVAGAMAIFLLAASFLVDQAWPVRYFETLFGFRKISPCGELCVSLPMAITSLFAINSTYAIWVGGILLLSWAGWFIKARLGAWKEVSWLISVAFCITLLSSPYQYNYDFVVLLLPLLVLASKVQGQRDWLWLALVYFLPWIGFIFSRHGNMVLLVSAFGLMCLLWDKGRHNQNFLDVHLQAKYNQENSLREE
jgi:Glycosyltransferase family 87